MLDPSLDLTPASEPAYCPSCGLKHTRRADWMCPRCGKPVDTELPPPKPRPVAPADDEDFPLGARIAGGAMVLAAAALAAHLARLPSGGHRWPALAAAVLVALLGVGSLLGGAWARWAAGSTAVVAAVALAEELLRERLPGLLPDPLPSAARAAAGALLRPVHPLQLVPLLAFAAGVFALLVGRPRGVRIGAGLLLAAPLVVSLALGALRG
jgi:hypothetical protein